MRRLAFVILVLALLPGCAPRPTPIIIVVTATAEPAPTLVLEPTSTITLEPTITSTPKPYPTWTPKPTSPKPTPTPRFISVPTSQTQDRGGVVVTIESFHLTPRSDHPQYSPFWLDDDVVTFGFFNVKIENTTDQIINVSPAFGTVVVGNEQVMPEVWGSDSLGSKLHPGVVQEGRIMFSLKRYRYDEVQHVLYFFNPPSDQDYKRLSDEDYRFEVAVTAAPLPASPTPKAADTLTPPPIPTPTTKLETRKTKQVWLSSTGTVWIHGALEITNVGDSAVDLGSIAFTVYAADGKVLETMSAFAIPNIIRSGEVAYAFEEATLDISTPAEVGELKVNFDYDVTFEEPQLLRVENLFGGKDQEGYKVTGEVVNTSEENARDILVAVALYDGAGNLLGVLVDAPDVTLIPGDKMGFAARSFGGLPPDIGEKVEKLVGVAFNWK